MINFYCLNTCAGGKDFKVNGEFSIEKWNNINDELEKLEVPEDEKMSILFPEQCKEQCFDCMAIVGETRQKNKHLTLRKNETTTDR
jgi:hypothetical protein